MSLLLDAAYLTAGLAAAPLLIAKSRRTGKYRTDWPARLGYGPDIFPKRSPDARLLLLHCVSVGELNSIQTLLTQLLAADPQLHIALTTTTDTATTRAQKLYSPTNSTNSPNFSNFAHTRIHPLRFPLDFTFAVESLFDRTQPDAIALVELETWPNFLAIAQDRRIPVALINGRLTARSLPRYRVIRPIMASMLQRLTWLGVQTDTIAKRFLVLGANPHNLEVIPTLKYDNADLATQIPGQDALANAMRLSPHHQLFVAGSTGPGEETPILHAYHSLRRKHPNLRLAIAPRHPEVVPQVEAAIKTANLTPLLRTDHPDPPTGTLKTQDSRLTTSEVFLLNTMGELKKLYALAFAAFIGRSLVPLGGSDMIEAAALAKPTLFGPHADNFTEAAELLSSHSAALIVHNAADLTQALDSLLSDPAAAHQMGRHAQSLIAQQRGSTQRYVQKLLQLCHHSS